MKYIPNIEAKKMQKNFVNYVGRVYKHMKL